MRLRTAGSFLGLCFRWCPLVRLGSVCGRNVAQFVVHPVGGNRGAGCSSASSRVCRFLNCCRGETHDPSESCRCVLIAGRSEASQDSAVSIPSGSCQLFPFTRHQTVEMAGLTQGEGRWRQTGIPAQMAVVPRISSTPRWPTARLTPSSRHNHPPRRGPNRRPQRVEVDARGKITSIHVQDMLTARETAIEERAHASTLHVEQVE